MKSRAGDAALLAVIGAGLSAVAEFGPFVYAFPLRTPLNPVFATAAFVGDLLWVTAMVASWWRDPAGGMWKLLLAARAVAALGSIWVLNTSLTWTLWQLTNGLGIVVFAHIVMAFPGGRLRSRYDRRVVAVAYGTLGLARVAWLLVWDPRTSECFPRCPVNPFVLWPNEWLATILGPGVTALVPVLAAAVVIGLWRRWRTASPAMRRTLLPVAAVAPIELGITAVRYVTAVDEGAWATVGIAISTSPLAFVHVLIPIGFLFGLLATRLARGGIADLAVELSRGIPLGALRDTLAHALRDPTLSLAFPAPTGGGFVDPHGRPVEIPNEPGEGRAMVRLERDGEVLAMLVYDAAIEAEDPGRVTAVASVARMALENERLAAQVRAQLEEVRASRSRIIEAADAERRRIERNLHDGAQQRLVALAMRLEQARDGAPGSAALIDTVSGELATAIREVRELARGVHPTILTERGLAAAVDALAERSPILVRVDVSEVPLPDDVAAAAYYLVAEGVTNAARHAAASEVQVRVAAEHGALVVTVADDGQGGADASRGSGLQGLVDRIAAIGGRLVTETSAGGGTTLRATIPLRGR